MARLLRRTSVSPTLDETRGQLVRIGVDLGLEELDRAGTRGARSWRRSLRREKPDFCALFAAGGLRQLETYLAKWAAYNEYLASSSRASSA
jgi:hypothetical protein